MTSRKLPRPFIQYCKSITAKRAKTVIDHLLEHGQITTEELKDLYGYNHPPRAIRDVRELGIPIDTFRVEGSDGRKIKEAYPHNIRTSSKALEATLNPLAKFTVVAFDEGFKEMTSK